MQNQWLTRLWSWSTALSCCALPCLGFLSAAGAQDTVELTVTGSWQAADYDVSSTGPTYSTGVPEENDDLVFGTAPSAGSTTFTLLVETRETHFFPAGTDGLAHNWYGYTNVRLAEPHKFGSASWETGDILTGLVGPGDTRAALWTDTDLRIIRPTRLSFRMIGSWEGANADLFIGSRTLTRIGNQFLLWEYYRGEEIRSHSYTARIGPPPDPPSDPDCRAIGGSLAITFKADGSTCHGRVAPGETLTLYTVAIPDSGPESRLTGAEFRVAGLPDGWIVSSRANPASTVNFGDPFAMGANIAFPSCEAEETVVLYEHTIVSTSEESEVLLEIKAHENPSNPTFPCALITLCDAPVYTKVAVSNRGAVVNPGSDIPCRVLTAVESTTWSSVKNLYRQ